MKLKLKNVRLAFPALFKAEAVNAGDTPAFSAAFILPKNHPQIAEINAAIEKAALDTWGAKAKTILDGLRKTDKVCLHDGDTKAQYEGYEGNYFINARNRAKPGVFDNTRDPATGKARELTEIEGRLYSGCYVNASVEVYAQDNAYGKRVNASLLGVQYAGEGDAFCGSQAAKADEFSDDLSDQGDDEQIA